MKDSSVVCYGYTVDLNKSTIYNKWSNKKRSIRLSISIVLLKRQSILYFYNTNLRYLGWLNKQSENMKLWNILLNSLCIMVMLDSYAVKGRADVLLQFINFLSIVAIIKHCRYNKLWQSVRSIMISYALIVMRSLKFLG